MHPPAPPTPAVPFSVPDEPPAFMFVKIPVSRHTIDPLHLREHQIDQALRAQALGAVVGWGDSLGAARADGKRIPAFIRIDITTPDLNAARAALHALLPTLETPVGTQIHYTVDAKHCMDLATEAGWQLALPPPPHPSRPGAR
ncbi:hypothetical protein CLU85_0944 [Acidovorax sp. 69]|uniref:hypothetical protein n=1 Tax=Acidovorax sp. 69 TaxID=2035202 RepID=UPI000C23847C|nr:hypothetical protein [Acidovorax sp. 69]PJI96203.1 hypothetical protein CLU85_0944 [Acidovorax sp. 69]